MKTLKSPSKVVIIPRPPVSDTQTSPTKQKSEDKEENLPEEEVKKEEGETEGEVSQEEEIE